ncbi:oxidoreductase [Muriicola sp. Z0-33]|nr:oxidoreductase [Muriicola sp. Z0-33]
MKYFILFCTVGLLFCCSENNPKPNVMHQASTTNIRLMTLDPGHFHAALVQKTMYKNVASTLYVYAPEGPEVLDYLDKIAAYNNRENSPTNWKVERRIGTDYLKNMLNEQPGNVMIVAGKNSKKIDYILEAVKAGINVYADKPLVINKEGYAKLKEAFRIAKEKNLILYDIMTERFESTTALQKLLSAQTNVFGELLDGHHGQPSIVKESVHHFFKYVSGKPLIRPPWFFDVNEEGDGIVDVTTHLVDLVQWEAFPGQVIDTNDIEMVSAKRWPTVLTLPEFQKVTGLDAFPEYLSKDIKEDKLHVYCNGEMIYKIRGKLAKVSVIWNYQAPEGTADTHYSIMRGSKSNLIIKQGEDEGYLPTLYVEAKDTKGFEASLKGAVAGAVAELYPGTTMEKISDGLWKINIPDEFKIGHEAHFAQVTENYLKYLENQELPDWEVPNMITKYYITTAAYQLAKAN